MGAQAEAPPGSFLFVFFRRHEMAARRYLTPGRFCPLAAHLYSTILCRFFPRSQRVYRRHPQTMYRKYAQKGTGERERGTRHLAFHDRLEPPNSLSRISHIYMRNICEILDICKYIYYYIYIYLQIFAFLGDKFVLRCSLFCIFAILDLMRC